MREVLSGNAGASVTDELDLGAVRRALWRKKWWVIIPTLLAAALSFAAVNMMTPRYKSEARILVEGRENVFLRPEVDKQTDRDRGALDQEAITSQVQLVLSREVAKKVIDELKLGERPEFDPVLRGVSPVRHVLALIGLAKDPLRMTPEERVVESYYERVTAYAVDKSRVIAVEFQSADPALAARAANAIANAYLALQQAARLDQTRVAGQWLGGEIETLRKRVAEAEARVAEYRAKSNLFLGTNNTTLSTQTLTELNAQLALARTQKADAEAKAKLIRSLLKSGEVVNSSDVLNSELIRRLAEQAATLRAQLAEQSSTLLGNHPRIKELKAQIADLDRQIRAEAEKIVRALENDARLAGSRVDSLSASLDQFKNQAASSNEHDVHLRALEREAKAQRDLLESYLAKYREATARDSLHVIPTEARIISPAAVSNTPAFPKKVPVILIATLATLLLSVGFITTGELLSGNVYRPVVAEPAVMAPEVADYAPAVQPAEPIAAPESRASSMARLTARWRKGRTRTVPEPKQTEGEVENDVAPSSPSYADEPAQRSARVFASERTAAAEPAFAAEPAAPKTQAVVDSTNAGLAGTLRTAGERGHRVTIVGAVRHAGATGTAIALARTLARDSRVVLLELALASPRIASLSTDPKAPGIFDLLRGTASFRHIITRDRLSRVHLIAAGHVGEDDARLLMSERLGIAVNALARTYDQVIIDAGALPDIPIERFVRLAPRAVLVAAGTPEDIAHAARDRLVAAGFTDVTVVVDEPPRPDAVAAGGQTRAA